MKQLDDFLAKQFNRIFFLLSGICCILYLLLLGGDYVWTDESYTFAMVKHSFSDIWRITGADVHPPLYYWYLKVLIAPFHYSLAAAKVASILPYMAIIMLGGKQIRKLFNERTAILFMGMFFCFPFALSYSIEIRMYSLASVFVFFCAVFAYEFWLEQGKIKNIIGIVISGVLAAYTHYFAFVSICIIYGLLLIAILKKRNLRWKWLVSVVISVILYSPWISSLINQLVYKVNNEYWIEKITIHTIVGYVDNLFGASGMRTYALFFSLAYLVCFIWILASKDKRDIMICLCCLLIPVGTLSVGVLASILVRPVFVIRYIIPSVSLLVLFMAIVLGKTDNSILLSVLLTVVLVGGISNYGVTLYSEYRAHNYVPINEYDDVDAYVVIASGHVAGTLAYYDTKTSIYYGDKVSNANPYPNRMKMGDFDTENVDKAILLLGEEETIPDEYDNFYDIEYIGQWKCEYDVDAYLMVKK